MAKKVNRKKATSVVPPAIRREFKKAVDARVKSDQEAQLLSLKLKIATQDASGCGELRKAADTIAQAIVSASQIHARQLAVFTQSLDNLTVVLNRPEVV